ncbi:ABC transporter permease [Verminephrobacter aporrectodeae]|uniref:ABC transporter permease n=1 Tax=Verminephrobacter aporrectodeae subsp. tuberculatae TaxID=1110392 RepID=A0ABT3KXG6_9BURK|nr:ABC transporter permease [Verminephrobacter aporrectodeae]MCW5221533.1 ABC transporter permease [Verminephrobacter aporrectodeae subsp. tuberculatae]MCW5257846.1 ABC transporter permease [Verminephrobacter aporrectodeae subsp. tuberculatae]MCW5290824.1 ABC transporter permease [Verminephrobacter aporrectodeae subsp. tuberculatae]MCW5323023.1 ABC transporter permease [Verminephrobacter aporrectodeae subsp. tuberculatae]MCW8166456.1 ABC transporter permease [Verminephrobacter aporrectodeae su
MTGWARTARRYGGILLALMALGGLFSVLSPAFLTVENLRNVVLQVSIIAIVAFGMTYVLLLGEIDLSVGALIALSGSVAGLLLAQGVAAPWAVAAALACGLALGALNGALSAQLSIPSFIVTVATMGIFRGLAYISSDGMPVTVDDEAFLRIGNGHLLGLPVPIWILGALLVLNHLVLSRSVFGRKVYLAGGNAEAAAYAGIRVQRLKVAIFMLSGLMASVGGMLLTARLYSAQPTAALGWELDAIAAAVLGGTSLSGGYGSMPGTLIGALIIGVINNGMNLMSVPYFYQLIVKGAVILIAVCIDVQNKKRRS